jgi:hypothetical protein
MGTCEDSIRGWELANLDPEMFDVQIIEVSEGCRHCEHLDKCGAPSESMRQLTPKNGRLVRLGQEQRKGDGVFDYYSLISGKDARYVLLKQPKHYWATACYVSEDQVPPWMLDGLSSRRSEE